MSYSHILVAVDLSEESALLVEKAVKLAKPSNALVSLIHVDIVKDDDFTRQIVSSLVAKNSDNKELQESYRQLQSLKAQAEYPIEQTLVSCGALTKELAEAVKKYEIDLIICGHHQNFWHNVSSSAKQVIKSISIDMLIVPLK